MSTRFLHDAWTLAAWASELTPGQPFARTLLGQPVVLWRDAQGVPQALHDRCPHRFAPLSMGKVCDGGAAIECPYHGLRFAASGACVLNPRGDGHIPERARVRRYPLVERHQALWIWMGDADKADPALIPPYPFLDAEHWAVGTGYMAVDGPYELEIDNILDLSHIEFLHPLFASQAVRRADVTCDVDGDTVWCHRDMKHDTEAPAFIHQAFGVPPGQPLDRWLDVRWQAPANLALWAGGVAAAQPREHAVVSQQAHCFTPEHEGRTHYFYAIAFPRALGPLADELAAQNVAALRAPFEHEDKPIIEAVARRMAGADLFDLEPVMLAGDAAAVRARRLLRARIAAQGATA